MLKSSLRSLKIADYILIVVILFAAGYIYYRQSLTSGEREVRIYVDDNLNGVYNLNKDQTININEHCSAQIKNHQIRMIQADCRDKLCVKQGWTKQKPVICLPNRVVIEIVNPKEQKQLHLLY